MFRKAGSIFAQTDGRPCAFTPPYCMGWLLVRMLFGYFSTGESSSIDKCLSLSFFRLLLLTRLFRLYFPPKRCRNTFTHHTPNGIRGAEHDTQTCFTILSKTYFREIDRRRHIKPSAAISTSLCLHKPNLTTYNPTPLTWGIAPRNSKSPSPHPFPPGRFGWAFARFVARWVL